MSYQIKPCLMFTGQAQAAIELYMKTFADAEILDQQTYQAGEQAPEGTLKLATIRFANQEVMFTNSPMEHDFSFTPSTSLFVTCEDEAALDRAYATLSEGGKDLMPPNNYGFSQKFAWVEDRFGVSWQINLP